ncbi:MAG: hypothetical protein U5Q44_08695 [Dehalococcoidia bacterium]|nr:hypothetical protein [Dehalococcoidia bacterium]
MDGDPNVFLVVWEHAPVSEDESEIFGRRIRAFGSDAGQPMGPAFQISEDAGGRAAAPSVAYERHTETFLVAWGDERGGAAGRGATSGAGALTLTAR